MAAQGRPDTILSDLLTEEYHRNALWTKLLIPLTGFRRTLSRRIVRDGENTRRGFSSYVASISHKLGDTPKFCNVTPPALSRGSS